MKMRLESERLTFQGATGAELAARLDRPVEAEVRGYALFAHCFTCSKDVFAASRISKALAERRMATLRFDFTGLGHSGGEFASTDFSSNVDDLVSAGEFLAENYQPPSLVVGHSLGGAAALAGADRIDGVDAVSTIAAPFRPSHLRHLFKGAIEEIRETGEAEVTLAGRTFRITQSFLEDLSSHRMHDQIADLNRPLLLFHSPLDEIVGIDNASRIFQAAKHPKSFVSLDDADHLLTDKADAEYVATVLSAWASRYLDESRVEEKGRAEAGEAPPEVELKPGQTYVGETGEGKFSNHVFNGEHYLRADEPSEHGGDGTGPSPYDLVTAGLGACTSMTLRMYADRKGWPLEKVEVRLTHEKVHAEDYDRREGEQGKIDRIERRIRIEGDLDDEQRQRLVEIADKCPVHRSLTRPNVIETTLESSDS